MKKVCILFSFILGLTLFCMPNVSAGEGTAGDYMAGMGTKFGRGLLNMVSSPLEVPCAIGDELTVRPGVGFFTGFGKGTLFMLRRILVGATEVGTFIIPMEATIPSVCQEKQTSAEVTA